jgi:uncharacterized protein YbjQ (UPF0145 family)
MTRIEDLGEYLHELNQEDEESTSFEPSEVSEIPTEENDFGTNDFASTEENNFESVEDETTFVSSEEPSFTTEETTDFGSSDFSTPEETPQEDPFSIEDESPFSDNVPTPIAELISTPEPEPLYQEEPEVVPEPTYSKPSEPFYKAPENFDDLKKFVENTSLTGMSAEGNPSFSVLLKNIRYTEDVNDILSLMKELNLLSDPEEQIRQRLMRGHLLVPRISEYAAIFLAHKLRRFDIDIQVGLSDEIHPPKHQEAPETGLVSKYTLYQNQTHHFHFDDPKLEMSQIIIAATPNLEGYQVIRYLGVASEHKMLEGHIVEDENSAEIPRYYSELAQKLKAHALKANANAVIGLNYQLTPLPSEYGMSGSKYRLSCTGNLVWVNKL